MANEIEQAFLEDAVNTFRDYKRLAEKAVAQVQDDELHLKIDEESNSIAIVMKHLAGNMISRWTDFLTSDGEKPNRNRDSEFEDGEMSREELMNFWERGWACLFKALDDASRVSLLDKVTIRGQQLSVLQAVNRQLTHYAYHIGQIVFLAKHIRSVEWKTLSIPKKGKDSAIAGEGLSRWVTGQAEQKS
jgi:uncharacterized damage-inducible protein DinB